jgi:DNA (cytosine-5)-methyltransferase 1
MHDPTLQFASLFSGCGGFDLGFVARGFRSFAAFDQDLEAVEVFQDNIEGPINAVDLTKGIPNERSLMNIDALIAGPPCQGFSTAGKRLLHDERNQLLTLTARLARRINPKVLVVENVPGALAGDHARYWKELTAIMRLGGYRTHTVKCQAADLGLPQLRKRVFFLAWRTGRELSFVSPQRRPGNLRAALAAVSKQQNHRPRLLKPGSNEWRIASRIKAGQKLCNVRGGPNAVATWEIPDVFGTVSPNERTVLEMLRRLRRQERRRENGDADPVSLPRLETALGARFRRLVEALIEKGYLRRIGNDVDLVGTFNGKFRRLCWDKPSCAVDTRFGSPRYFLHPSRQRGFTVREAARLQGFGDDYVFRGNENSHFRLIGNAVPPQLGALAAVWARQLLGRP